MAVDALQGVAEFVRQDVPEEKAGEIGVALDRFAKAVDQEPHARAILCVRVGDSQSPRWCIRTGEFVDRQTTRMPMLVYRSSTIDLDCENAQFIPRSTKWGRNTSTTVIAKPNKRVTENLPWRA